MLLLLFILIQISVGVKASRPASLVVTQATFAFLSLLPSTESLASRGRRLHDTPAQRQTPTYAPDVKIKVEVVEASHRLLANFVDDRRLVLAQGETVALSLWLSNSGTQSVDEAWIVTGPDDQVWVAEAEADEDGASGELVLGVQQN